MILPLWRMFDHVENESEISLLDTIDHAFFQGRRFRPSPQLTEIKSKQAQAERVTSASLVP